MASRVEEHILADRHHWHLVFGAVGSGSRGGRNFIICLHPCLPSSNYGITCEGSLGYALCSRDANFANASCPSRHPIRLPEDRLNRAFIRWEPCPAILEWCTIETDRKTGFHEVSQVIWLLDCLSESTVLGDQMALRRRI